MVDNQSASYESHLVMERRKRRVLTISEKMELISLTEKFPKNKKAIAAKFKIPVHTLNTIYASREKIFEKCSKGNFSNMNLKRLRKSTYPDIEESLFDWYKENHANGHISGLVLREKALQLAKTFGHETFSASCGWVERFKSRHNLKFRKTEDKTNINSSTDDSFLDAVCEKFHEEGICNENQKELDPVPVHKPVKQLFEIKQEYDDNKDFMHETSCSLGQNHVDIDSSPCHILPEIHLSETNISNLNFSINAVKAKTSNDSFMINDVEKAFNIVYNYIENCDENVNEKTSEALNTLKVFITKEKERRAQTKITDYFSYSENCNI